jgi:glutathione S-transferase
MILIASACVVLATATPFRPLPADGRTPDAAKPPGEGQGGKTDASAAHPPVVEGGVANLPYAFGKRFASLDDYLVHLERRAGPIDMPWWRQTSPGIYEHVKRGRGGDREIATRAELIKRFGFAR